MASPRTRARRPPLREPRAPYRQAEGGGASGLLGGSCSIRSSRRGSGAPHKYGYAPAPVSTVDRVDESNGDILVLSVTHRNPSPTGKRSIFPHFPVGGGFRWVTDSGNRTTNFVRHPPENDLQLYSHAPALHDASLTTRRARTRCAWGRLSGCSRVLSSLTRACARCCRPDRAADLTPGYHRRLGVRIREDCQSSGNRHVPIWTRWRRELFDSHRPPLSHQYDWGSAENRHRRTGRGFGLLNVRRIP